jgi:hypothetical protein
MTRYQKGFKVKHRMEIIEFQMNSLVAKQVNPEIINKFFDPNPK